MKFKIMGFLAVLLLVGAVSLVTAAPVSKCTDWDRLQNGTREVYVAGYANVSASKFSRDVCVNNLKLREYGCTNNKVTSKVISCVYGCKAGACLRERSTASPLSGKVTAGAKNLQSPQIPVSGSGNKFVTVKVGNVLGKFLVPRSKLGNYVAPKVVGESLSAGGSECMDWSSEGVFPFYSRGWTQFTNASGVALNATDGCGLSQDAITRGSANTDLVIEYSCDNSQTMRTTIARCPRGCSNGACKLN